MSRPPLSRRLLAGLLSLGACAAIAPAGAGAATGFQSIDVDVPLTCTSDRPRPTDGTVPSNLPWPDTWVVEAGVRVRGTLPGAVAPGETFTLADVDLKLSVRGTYPDPLEPPDTPAPRRDELAVAFDPLALSATNAAPTRVETSVAPLVGLRWNEYGSRLDAQTLAAPSGGAPAFDVLQASGAGPVALRLGELGFTWTAKRTAEPDRAPWGAVLRCTQAAATPPIGVVAVGTEPVPAPPAVTSVSPAEGPTEGGYEITVEGERLATTRAVEVASDDADFRVIDDSTLVVTVPSTPGEGWGRVAVFTDFGESPDVPADDFRYYDGDEPAPVGQTKAQITGVAPATAAAGESVVVTGTNLDLADQVYVEDAVEQTTRYVTSEVVSPTQMRVVMPGRIPVGRTVSVRLYGPPDEGRRWSSRDTPADDITRGPRRQVPFSRELYATCDTDGGPGRMTAVLTVTGTLTSALEGQSDDLALLEFDGLGARFVGSPTGEPTPRPGAVLRADLRDVSLSASNTQVGDPTDSGRLTAGPVTWDAAAGGFSPAEFLPGDDPLVVQEFGQQFAGSRPIGVALQLLKLDWELDGEPGTSSCRVAGPPLASVEVYGPASEPVVRSISPSTGPVEGGTVVTVAIDGLDAETDALAGASVGPYPAELVGASSGVVGLRVPRLPAAGAYPIRVWTYERGSVDVPAGVFTATATDPTDPTDPTEPTSPTEPARPLAVPTSVAPQAVYAGLGGIVRIRGTNLRSTTTVTIGTRKVKPLWIASAGELWVIAPGLKAGSYPVTLTNANGTSPAGAVRLTYRRLF